MSHLWAEQIRIVLHPTQVVLCRIARGRSQRIIDKCVVPGTPRDNGTPPWRGALSALEVALPAFCTRKSEATVILSNHFVRYALVMNTDRVSTADEEQALVNHHFARVYGDASTRWNLIISRAERPDRPRVACAVDRALTDALRALFPAKQPILRSIQPYLMAAYNQYRNQFQASSWLVLVEDGILCLARLEERSWQSIKCIKIGINWRHDLAIQLDREAFLSGHTAIRDAKRVPVIVFAPEYPEPIDVTPEHDPALSIQQRPVNILDPSLWPEPPQADDPVHAMALVG